jgi:hypothetical protein
MPIPSASLSEPCIPAEELTILSNAFEETLCALRLADRNDPAITLVAKRLIDLALSGERDPSGAILQM